MLSIPYGKIYRARIWNVNDAFGRLANASTVTGRIVVQDLISGDIPVDTAMAYQADGDMFFDIPAELATVDRQVSVVMTASSIPLVDDTNPPQLLVTENYRVQYIDTSI